MKNTSLITLIIGLVCVHAYQVMAQERVTLQEGLNGYDGTTDTSIFQDRVSNALGGSAAILTGSTASSVRRGLLRFDLTIIPKNANVLSAVLTLIVDAQGPGSGNADEFQLIPLVSSWGEGNRTAGTSSGSGSGNGAPAQNGDATWLSNFHNQSVWQTPGGDFDSSQLSTSQVVNQALVFESDVMRSTIQQWVGDETTNHGWILLGNEEGTRTARRMVSSEGNQNERPVLNITYQLPVSVDDWPVY